MASFSGQPAASADDGYINSASSWQIGGVNLTHGNSGGTTYTTFIRIPNVTIPAGSTITAATITTHAGSSQSGVTCNITIKGDKEANPAQTTSFADANGRPLTTASVAWSALPAQTSGLTYVTPDLTAIITELIAQGGWASGNAMQFFFQNNASSVGAFREATPWDTSPANSPQLQITYTLPGVRGGLMLLGVG